MAEERIHRRLAAILATDVVGYSRLMEIDESGTLSELKSRRKAVLEPLLARHDGRVFKVTGDGVMVEFASAVNAVACAVDLQHGMAHANRDQPENCRIVLRVGVNLGDVIVEGGDLYGDSVNIAARLEALAQPGDILVSGTAYDYVRNKVKVAFADLGAQSLKNIAEPVRVYRATGTPAVPVTAPKPAGDKPSIAVLPFVNMSGDPDQQYFSDGITEDIITELSRFRGLYVLARNASFQFRGKAVDVKRVGRELGVQYVVEGSVRRLGDRIRITAQLTDVGSGNHLWAERYDRDQKDIFEVQDHVVRSLVGTLVGRVEAAGAEQFMRKSPASLMAYDYVLRGSALPVGDIQAEADARRMYEKAIELDPAYGVAHGLLAMSFSFEWLRDMTGSNVALDRALNLAKKAVQLDDTNSDCNEILARMHLLHRDFDLAEHYFQRALTLNPNNTTHYTGYAEWLTFVGRADEAIECYKQAQLVDPHFNPGWFWRMFGVAYFNARQYDQAIATISRSPTLPDWVQAYIAASHAHAQRAESAKKSAAEVLRLSPGFKASWFLATEPYKRPVDQEHLLVGLRKAGLPA